MRDGWKYRRRIVFGTLIWLVINLEYLILFGEDSALNQQAFIAMIGLFGSVVGIYVFGATWDDHSKRTFGSEGDEEQAVLAGPPAGTQ